MYGGLFGDLPAAKNKEGTDKSKKDDSQNDKQFRNVGSKKRPAVEEPPKQSSLVQTLGAAGTSMAFIPSHVNRKRTVKKTTPAPNWTAANKAAPHATTEFAAVWKEERQTIGTFSSPTDDKTTTTVQESEELQRLHESVTDPYDPLVPNDLLQYWERQAAIHERKEIEREARETMDQQIRIRQQLERERQELEKTGDVDKIVEHRKLNTLQQPGRGRGRGLSNLPAWLVEKQKKEAQMRSLKDEANND